MMPASLTRNQWFQVVAECEEFAGSSLRMPETDQVRQFREESVHHIHHHHYAPAYGWGYGGGWGGWDWSTHNTTIIEAPRREKTEEEKKEDSARTAMWVGGLCAAAAAFAVGYFYNQYQDEAQSMGEARGTLDIANKQQDVPYAVRRVVETRHSIHERNYTNTRNRLIASAVILAGGASAVAGGLMMVPAFITAGYVALFAGAFFALLNAGLHWSDADKNQKVCAGMLHTLIPAARNTLRGMPSEEPPPYYADSFYHPSSAPEQGDL